MAEKIDRRDEVLAFIREKGPILPIDINKIMGNTLFSGAILSQLADSKLVKISYAKIGGSPVYYVPGQEPELEILYSHLKDPEKKAYMLLKEKGVLRDIALQPVQRVALREIKDFAIPLTVTYSNTQEIFWKWHLFDDEKAKGIIKGYLDSVVETKPEAKAEKLKIDNDIEKEISKAKQELEHEKSKELEMLKKELESLKKKYEEKDSKEKIEMAKKLAQSAEKEEDEIIEPLLETKSKEAEKETKPEKRHKEQELQKTLTAQQIVEDNFLKQVMKFMKDNGIEINSYIIIKKNNEIDFIINVPSAVGFIEYYCKAKNKKRVNEGDISTAFVQGQMKKLPVLYLTPGEFTKKAKEMLKNEFKNINTKQI